MVCCKVLIQGPGNQEMKVTQPPSPSMLFMRVQISFRAFYSNKTSGQTKIWNLKYGLYISNGGLECNPIASGLSIFANQLVFHFAVHSIRATQKLEHIKMTCIVDISIVLLITV